MLNPFFSEKAKWYFNTASDVKITYNKFYPGDVILAPEIGEIWLFTHIRRTFYYPKLVYVWLMIPSLERETENFRNFYQIFTFWDPLSQKNRFLRNCLSVQRLVSSIKTFF